MNKIIVANWKSHPETLPEAEDLFRAEVEVAQKYSNVQTVICPPEFFITQLGQIAFKYLGAQDIFWESSKPDFPLSHVLVGHSDRRYGLGESDEVVNKKIKAVLDTRIVPVLLVGEREGERREDILKSQLEKDLAGISPDQFSKILFCYEPVWAISRPAPEIASALSPQRQFGPDTPESVLGAYKIINNFVQSNFSVSIQSILYGGSVNEGNISSFLSKAEIFGAVIGKASLDAIQFSKILNIVNNIK